MTKGFLQDIIHIACKINVEWATDRFRPIIRVQKLQKKIYVLGSRAESLFPPSGDSLGILEIGSEGIFESPFFWSYSQPSTLWRSLNQNKRKNSSGLGKEISVQVPWIKQF